MFQRLRHLTVANTSNTGLLSPLGRRLLFSVLMVSSIVTLLASAAIIWSDYRDGVRLYDKVLEQISSGYQNSITYSLWNFDSRQLDTQLQGIMNFPGVIYVQIDHDGQVLQSLGNLYEKGDRNLVIPLDYTSNDTPHHLGLLRITQSYKSLYESLQTRGVDILISQFLLTLSVSVLMLLIVHRLVTRRLGRMADWALNFRLENPELALNVDHPGYEQDEISQVADAINRMRLTLKHDLERREAENQQREQLKEQLSLAVDNAALGFCRYDIPENTFYCNSHFAGQLGTNEVSIESLKEPMAFFLSHFTGAEADKQRERVRQLLQGNQVRLHDTFLLLNQQQQQRYFDISLQVIRYHENRPQQILICMIDRTAEVTANQHLNDLETRREQETHTLQLALQRENEELKEAQRLLQQELLRLRSNQRHLHMNTLCHLMSGSIRRWHNARPQTDMELWLHFLERDLFGKRISLDISRFVREKLEQVRQRYGITITQSIPLSLIMEEDPAVLEALLHLLFPADVLQYSTQMSVHIKLSDNRLATEIILTSQRLPDQPEQALSFKLAEVLMQLHYEGTLSIRKNQDQLQLRLSMPLSE